MLAILLKRQCWLTLLLLVLLTGWMYLSGALSPAYASGPQRACAQGLVQQPNTLFQHASFEPGQKIPKWHLHITYIGHSTFLIETPQGVSAATDYNGVHVPPFVPDLVTMNNLHETHYTDTPDPKVKYVLRGWDPLFGIARNNVRVKDLHVYSIPTNIHEFNGKKTNENSIFVFGAAGLCLAHVGHLHHILTKRQKFRLENIDVLFLPIGGFATVSHEEALKIIEQITPKIIIPMHYHYPGAKGRFTKLMQPHSKVKIVQDSTIRLSKKNLPKHTEVHFIKPLDPFYRFD
ncbi:MAG: MBL fold metallo-hydrolase [Rhodospirillaceae bacterium]|jgi:L-ascorbate metabolism protein UlaG (beta-lactamase superfamily)